jgi:tetratricopeptide (TPR) repeat protein
MAHILLHEWVWQKAETEFRKAIELNPNYVLAHHWYALCLTALGKVEQAVTTMERALTLDPLSTRINADLGMAYLAAGRYAEAVEQETRTLELAPNATTANWIRGMALEQMGHFDQAEVEMRLVREDWGPDPAILGSLGHLLAVAGKPEEARDMLSELVAQDGQADIAFFAALIHVALNEPEQAMAWLDRAVQERSGSVRYLKIEPRLASLHDQPGYGSLMERVGLPRE